jgi:archaellum component FlaD/FlaE
MRAARGGLYTRYGKTQDTRHITRDSTRTQIIIEAARNGGNSNCRIVLQRSTRSRRQRRPRQSSPQNRKQADDRTRKENTDDRIRTEKTEEKKDVTTPINAQDRQPETSSNKASKEEMKTTTAETKDRSKLDDDVDDYVSRL